MSHLVIMAAGTGGHIVPGLAVAREMQARGWSVSWLGTEAGMENKLVPPTGLPLDRIGFSGLRGKGLLHTLTGGVRLLKAFWDCLLILRRRSADAVLGMGGYVCFPGGVMASLLGKPLLLVNADAALLLSNKALLPVADRVAFGFDGQAARATRRALVTGNPVRAEIEALPAPAERFAARSGPLQLLVIGGSLGAKVLNDTLPAALSEMAPAERPRVTHQTGSAHLDAVQAAYARAGVEAELLPFIDDMAQRLAACDLAAAFLQPWRSSIATSPTKVGEYLASGLPTVVSSGIADGDRLVTAGLCAAAPSADAEPRRRDRRVCSWRNSWNGFMVTFTVTVRCPLGCHQNLASVRRKPDGAANW